MKRTLTPEFIDAQLVPASSLRCLMPAVLNRVAQAEPRGIIIPNNAWGMFSNAAPHPLRYLQHIEKGRMS